MVIRGRTVRIITRTIKIMTNQYFNFYKENKEWDLYNKMSDETIEIFGIQCFYMPRKSKKVDMLFGEDVGSYFTSETAFEISMYLEDPLSFSSDENYTKWGINIDNTASLFVQQDRLREAIGDEPFFGDLIYIPMFNRLFEVTNPEEKSSHFLFGRLMIYNIKVTLIKFNQEKIDVGIPEIDDLYGKTSVTVSLEDNMTDAEQQVVDYIDFTEKNPFNE